MKGRDSKKMLNVGVIVEIHNFEHLKVCLLTSTHKCDTREQLLTQREVVKNSTLEAKYPSHVFTPSPRRFGHTKKGLSTVNSALLWRQDINLRPSLEYM